MNFNNIAELVHELAKSPNQSSAIISKFKSISEVTNCELETITKVFSQEELSGDLLAVKMSPSLYWF